MNPAIVIPTYWAKDPARPGVYDHATALDTDASELERCLSSLDKVAGILRTFVLLVAPPRIEAQARERVEAIVSAHPKLNSVIVGTKEARLISEKIDYVCPTLDGETVSLRGYGAIRNMGLVAAAIFGHDVVVFLDDDEVVLSPSFLTDAMYGLGQITRQDLPIVAKSGHFIDAADSHLADQTHPRFWQRWWSKRTEFNEWMRKALMGTRISRSNYVCGGCMALHANAFSRVAFDPWITRGEDLDYLFNLRMVGLEMWFDRDWYVKHLPPATPDEPNRFLQNVYRWLYERAKLETVAKREDLYQVTPASLMPYPGRWISSEIDGRVSKTALLRALLGPERAANLRIWLHGRHEAQAYAEENSKNYLQLLTIWPRVIRGLWNDSKLALAIKGDADDSTSPQ